MKEKNRKIPLWWLVAASSAALLLYTLIIANSYRSYQEKIDVLAKLVQEDQVGLDGTLGLLKGAAGSTELGRGILEKYGYLDLTQTAYGRRFIKECVFYGGTLVLLGGFIVILLLRQRKMDQRKREYLLALIEERLVRFRERDGKLIVTQDSQKELYRINEQLEALQDYLEMVIDRAAAEKEGTKGLVTDISHQLKTPVAALDTCLSILEQENLSEEEQREFTKRCRTGLDGLKLLLQSLLQISKLEAGLIQIERKRAPIFDTIVTAVNRIYPKASEKQIELSVEYEEEQRQLMVRQDTKWLCEAILNILENAVKYSPKESEIIVSLQKRSSFVRIEITDQGIGIPKEEYHKIFQRFYRGSQSRVKEESGSGVGLYLVREIIKKHHGTVSVASRHAEEEREHPGSTFVIHIPLDTV